MLFEKIIDHLPLSGCQKTPGAATCLQDVETAWHAFMKTLNFTHINYSFVQANDEPNPDASLNVSFTPIFSDYPDDWMNHYIAQEYYLHDPILKMLELVEPGRPVDHGTWRQARVSYLEHHNDANIERTVKRLFEDSARFGLCSGVYMIFSSGLANILISLVSPLTDDALDAFIEQQQLWKKLIAFGVLANQSLLETRGCDLCSRNVRLYGLQEINFSKTQKQILQLYANHSGATLNDIAKLQGISAETVKFHLKTIRQKLNKPKLSGQMLAQFASDHNLL